MRRSINHLDRGKELLTGAVGGLLLYLVNFYGFTAIFPWFAMARNWITIFSHIVFGLVAAAAYLTLVTRHHRHETGEGANLHPQGA